MLKGPPRRIRGPPTGHEVHPYPSSTATAVATTKLFLSLRQGATSSKPPPKNPVSPSQDTSRASLGNTPNISQSAIADIYVKGRRGQGTTTNSLPVSECAARSCTGQPFNEKFVVSADWQSSQSTSLPHRGELPGQWPYKIGPSSGNWLPLGQGLCQFNAIKSVPS